MREEERKSPLKIINTRKIESESFLFCFVREKSTMIFKMRNGYSRQTLDKSISFKQTFYHESEVSKLNIAIQFAKK